MRVSKRFLERAKTGLRRYQKILESARSRDVNESDTVVVVTDFLSDVLGYDKYHDVTTEFAVRSTFCDLAIKIGGRVRFLIEVKSVGTDLKDNHLRQAVDYAANEGVEWVLLTNGAEWHAYRLRFEQPIQHDEVFAVNLLDPEARPAELLGKLYLISKEASPGDEIERYWRHKEATNRYVVAQLLLSPTVLGVIRRQLRQQYRGLKVSTDELGTLIREEILKRDVLEGERAQAAERLVRRATRRQQRAKETAGSEPPVAAPPTPTASSDVVPARASEA